MSAVPIIALTIGALLLTLGLSSSSRRPKRDRGGDGGGDGDGWASDGGGDCGGDGGGCD